MSQKNCLASMLYIRVLPFINPPKEQTFEKEITLALLKYGV